MTKLRREMSLYATYVLRMTPPSSLNYQHLLYFWMVAKEGGLAPAGKVLRLSHPTLSAQIHQLEDRLGEKLFTKVGRKLALTEVGRIVFRYAEEIFSLGRELVDAVEGRTPGKPLRLEVGIVDVLPKLVVRKLLHPALSLSEPVHLVCHEGSFDRLLADLSQHALDIVLADSPVPSGGTIRAHSHLLGECSVGFFATAPLIRSYGTGFPASLASAPFVLPAENLSLRRSLNHWFEKNGIRPFVVAEFEDSALLKVFGADGVGVFPAPIAVEREVETQYHVDLLGVAEGVQERFYAISLERRLTNPAVVAISRAAHRDVFGGS